MYCLEPRAQEALCLLPCCLGSLLGSGSQPRFRAVHLPAVRVPAGRLITLIQLRLLAAPGLLTQVARFFTSSRRFRLALLEQSFPPALCHWSAIC